LITSIVLNKSCYQTNLIDQLTDYNWPSYY